MTPGRLFVKNFSPLQFVPAWFPGAGCKGDLEYLSSLTKRMTVDTYYEVKQRIDNGTQGEDPSLIAQL